MRLLLFCLVCSTSFADTKNFFMEGQRIDLPQVPVVSLKNFEPSTKWVWEYHEVKGGVYSTEQYEVLARKGDVVLIEMSTKFHPQETLIPHHRIEVNISRCLQYYLDPINPVPWSIRLFYKNGDQWTLVDGLDKTLAFEEKFNCDPYAHASREKKTIFEKNGDLALFQQRRWDRDDSSWYYFKGKFAGVLARKNMVHGYFSKPTHVIHHVIQKEKRSSKRRE